MPNPKKDVKIEFRADSKMKEAVEKLAELEHRSPTDMAREIIRRYIEGEAAASGGGPVTIEGLKGEDKDILYIAHNLKNKEDYRQWKRQGIYYLKNPTEGQGLTVSESAEPKTKKHSKQA